MTTKDRKKKLRKLLAKLNPSTSGELLVKNVEEDIKDDLKKIENKIIQELKTEIENTKNLIPSPIDIDPIYRDIGSLRNLFARLDSSFNELKNRLVILSKEKRVTPEELAKFEEMLKQFMQSSSVEIATIRNNHGGGSMNRQILIDGVNPLTRYTDYNIIAGSGITITTANDDTKRRVNLTFAATGGMGSQEKSTTVPDGVFTTFSFAHTPKVIFWNGAFQTLTDDYTVSGSTITFTGSAGIPQAGDKIVNLYS